MSDVFGDPVILFVIFMLGIAVGHMIACGRQQ